MNAEELISLRKIAESPSVRYDNISAAAGQPLPYLFAPFQVLVVSSAQLSHVDVAVAYSMLWALASGLAILATVGLVRVVFDDWLALPAAILFTLATHLDGEGFYYSLGILAPYPNRYGIASGVLLPLVLYSLFQYLKAERQGRLQLFLLSYLTVETTFVHARETLFLCATILATGCCLILARGGGWSEARRLLGVLVATGFILWTYKEVNLTLGKELGGYVASLGRDSRLAFNEMVEERGPVGALFDAGDLQIHHREPGWTGAPVTYAPGYIRLFIHSWALDGYRYLGHLRYMLVVFCLVLPLLCVLDRRTMTLSLAASFTGFLLFALLGAPRLWVSSVVGNPEVLDSQNIVFLLGWCAFIGFVGALTRLIVERAGAKGLGLVILAVAALSEGAGLWLNSPEGSPVGTPIAVAWALHISALIAIVFGLRSRVRSHTAALATPVLVISATLVGCAFLTPALVHRRPAPEPDRVSGLTGQLIPDYEDLMRENLLPSSTMPRRVLRYVREKVPAHAVVISRDTLPLMTVAVVHVPFVATNGFLGSEYVDNAAFLGHYAVRPNHYSMADFVATFELRAQFREFLETSKVEFVIANAAETKSLADHSLSPSDLGLEGVFTANGFTVFKVTPARGSASGR